MCRYSTVIWNHVFVKHVVLGIVYFCSNPTSQFKYYFFPFFFCCLSLCRPAVCDLAWFTTARHCQMLPQGTSLLYPSCLAGSLASQHALTCSFIHPSPLALWGYHPPLILHLFPWHSASHCLVSPLSFSEPPPLLAFVSWVVFLPFRLSAHSLPLLLSVKKEKAGVHFYSPSSLSHNFASKKDTVSPRDLLGAVKMHCPNFMLIQGRVT